MKISKTSVQALFLCSMLLALSGCWPFSKKKNSGVNAESSGLDDSVLLKINGNVALTVEEYESLLQTIIDQNPESAALFENMPGANEEFFKRLLMGKLMAAWAEKTGVSTSPEFLAEQKLARDSIDYQLCYHHYELAHPVSVSDKEIEDFYLKVREISPGLVVTAGGIVAHSLQFEDKKEAEAFYAAVKTASKQKFKKEADVRHATLQDLLINQSSQYPDAVKKYAERVTKTPHTELIPVSENAYWVIQAVDKQKAEYLPLNTPGLKEQIAAQLESDKRQQSLNENIETLKKEMNVLENHEYFAKKAGRKTDILDGEDSMSDLEQDFENNSNNIQKA